MTRPSLNKKEKATYVYIKRHKGQVHSGGIIRYCLHFSTIKVMRIEVLSLNKDKFGDPLGLVGARNPRSRHDPDSPPPMVGSLRGVRPLFSTVVVETGLIT